MPESTLRHKLSAYRPSNYKAKALVNRLFTDEEEAVFVNAIHIAQIRGLPFTVDNILRAVEYIIDEDLKENSLNWHCKNCLKASAHTKNHHGWFRGFRKRNPKIVFRTPENLSKARLELSETVIRQWFADVKCYMEPRGLLSVLAIVKRVFNFDETSIKLGPKQTRVLGFRGEKHCFQAQANNEKACLTILSMVGADGSVPPLMVIYPRKRLEAQMVKVARPYHFICGKSENGWITFETLFEYLVNGFDKWLRTENIQRPVLVFCDWHETRANYFLAQRCTSLGIVLIGLLPNTTHILQPLDVGVFGPLQKKMGG